MWIGLSRCWIGAQPTSKRSDPVAAGAEVSLGTVSDIPIGSPPVPPGRHAAPQGWYPDPVDHNRERYWDGWSWSRNTRESTHPSGHQSPLYPHGSLPADHDHQTGRDRPQGRDQQSGYQQGGYQQQPGQQQPGQQFRPDPYQQLPHQQHPYQQPYPHAGGPPAPPALTADGVPIAGWGWRFLAGILDLIVVTIVADIASIPILVKMLPVIRQYFNAIFKAAQTGSQPPPALNPTALLSSNDQILVTVISLVVGLLYFSLFWRLKAATPAQLLFGLRIVPADHGHNTELLPWQTVIVRALTWWVPIAVSNVLLIFTIVNVLFPLGNVKRQAIHDLAARTQIVKIR